MSAAKLRLIGACAAAAVLAALWWSSDESDLVVERTGPQSATAHAVAGDSRAAAVSPAVVTPPGSASPPPQTADSRATDAELQAQLAEESYARLGVFLVDHLAARGLARVDGERVVRRFFDDNARCLFDALRVEAEAQSVSYDQALDAIEADIHETDGPLLGAVIDIGAVQARATPCGLTAAQQAGFGPADLEEAARAAVRRRAP